jgi:hypothetical protein
MMADAVSCSPIPTPISKLDARIAALSDMSREDLVAEWIKIYKCKPPRSVKRGLLERAVAYRYQTRRYGKLKAETVKTLLAIACRDHAGKPDCDHDHVHDGDCIKSVVPVIDLKPGTRLVREWHGQTYQVNITDNGIIWNNTKYSSLSAIARAITGARWSGPRFFGL